MTTPRVYTVSLDNPDYIDTGKIAFRPTKERPTNVPMFIQAEVILLSDHKEVVKVLGAKYENAVQACKDGADGTRQVIQALDAVRKKLAASEALVKRQALAIEKLKEQRNYLASHVPITSSAFNGDITGLDSQITAILQEAK